MWLSVRASEMRRRRSWNRPSAQEPGAAVRKPRLAWWTDHPSANAGTGCGDAECPRTARVGDLTKQAPWQVRTRPSRALFASSPRVRGQEVIGRSPSALLLLPPNQPSSATDRCEANAVGARGQTPRLRAAL